MAVLSSPISLKAFFFCNAWRVDTIEKSSNDKVRIAPLACKFARHNCSNWLTIEHASGACAVRGQNPVEPVWGILKA